MDRATTMTAEPHSSEDLPAPPLPSDHARRDETERRLSESEQRFRAIAEMLPQMVWTAGPDGQIDYFGPRWSAFTGLEMDELLAGAWLQQVHPDDRIIASAPVPPQEDAISGRTFRLRNAAGEYRWMETQARAVRDAEGRIERWFGATLDITERREAEDRQRAQADHLEAGAELAGLGTFIWELGSPDDEVIVDARYRRIHGITAGTSLTGRSIRWWLSHIHPDDRARVDAAARAALTPGGPRFQQEYRFLRDTPGGPEERWLACAARVEFLSDGRPHRMIGTVQDITLSRQQDEMRVRLQKVEAIGTLVGAVAHDFNNVIGAILTYARVADAELAAGQSPAESLHEIARGAHRAGEMLGRLMTFAREEVPRRERFALGAVVDEAVALVRPTFPAGVEVRVRLDAAVPALIGDPTQIHQVLVNLLTNAAQALGESPGSIRVSTSDVKLTAERAGAMGVAPGRYARVVVADTGPGFDDAVAHRLFDPFFTTKPAGEGTGLGLSAVQSIVAAHGGTVSAYAPNDGGAIFTVHLPLSAPPAPTPARPQAAPEGAAAEPSGSAPVRVLFVDDEPALARLALRALPREGHVVRAFVDSREALAFAQAQPEDFDVLVTDLTMPHLDGLSLIAELRAMRPELPVVLSSGYLSPQAEAAARTAGVNVILSKPSSIEALSDAIFELVSR